MNLVYLASITYFYSVRAKSVPNLPGAESFRRLFDNTRHTSVEKISRGGSVTAKSKFFRHISETDQMPSLFSGDESIYDKYAACLAATEGLRRLRDRGLSSEASDKEAQKDITSQYVQNCGKVLKSLGMTISEFNKLGKDISKNEPLKERVRSLVDDYFAYTLLRCLHSI